MNGKIYINNIEYDLSTLTQEQIDSLIKYGTLTGTTASTAVIIDNDTLKGEGTAESPFKVAKTPGTLTFKGETGDTLYNGSADTTVDIGAFKDVFDKDTIKGEGTTDSPLHIEYDILDDVQVAVSHATKALTTIEDVETDISKAIDNSEEAYNYALEAYNVAQTAVSTHNLNGDDSVINSATSVSSITLVGLNQEITYTEKDKDGKEIEYKLVGEIFNDYQNNSAMGKYSHAEGYCTVASADCEHVQGRYNLEDNTSGYSFVIGNGSASTACSNAMTVDWSGNTYIQGNLSADTVYGNAMKDGSGRVITEFYQQKVSAGTNIGLDKDNYIISSYTNTYNINGDETDANYKSGITEVSEVGAYQVTEYFPTGNTASTTGLSYSAVGEVFNDYKQNSAFGAYSHAEGLGTIASGKAQHVQGKYNIASGDSAAVIIGNGLSASERSNAFIMDWSGNAIFYGSVSAQSISGEVDYASSAGTAEKDYKGNVIDTTYNKNITFYDLNGDNTSAYTASAITNVVLVGHSVKTEDKTDTAQTIVNVGEIFNDYSGNVATGQYSHAEGHATSAIGENSHAEGSATIAFMDAAHAEGLQTYAYGQGSHSEGYNTSAVGVFSHSMGIQTQAQGDYSCAGGLSSITYGIYDLSFGKGCTTSGIASTSFGVSAIVNGDASFVIGSSTTVSGIASFAGGTSSSALADNSLAYGLSALANGSHSVALGMGDIATNNNSVALGYYNISSGIAAVSMGYMTSAITDYSYSEGYRTYSKGGHSEGTSTSALSVNSHSEGKLTQAIGGAAHSEGLSTFASQPGAHAEGLQSSASSQGAHSEGSFTIANNTAAHAEGNSCLAEGEYSHSEGSLNIVSGQSSHAEGSSNRVSGSCSHAEGFNNVIGSSFKYAHVEGSYNIVSGDNQHIMGTYNKPMTNNCAFIIGNGSSDTSRNNCLTVDNYGNMVLEGELTDTKTYAIYSSTAATLELTGRSQCIYVGSTSVDVTEIRANGFYKTGDTLTIFGNGTFMIGSKTFTIKDTESSVLKLFYDGNRFCYYV